MLADDCSVIHSLGTCSAQIHSLTPAISLPSHSTPAWSLSSPRPRIHWLPHFILSLPDIGTGASGSLDVGGSILAELEGKIAQT